MQDVTQFGAASQQFRYSKVQRRWERKKKERDKGKGALFPSGPDGEGELFSLLTSLAPNTEAGKGKRRKRGENKRHPPGIT